MTRSVAATRVASERRTTLPSGERGSEETTRRRRESPSKFSERGGMLNSALLGVTIHLPSGRSSIGAPFWVLSVRWSEMWSASGATRRRFVWPSRTTRQLPSRRGSGAMTRPWCARDWGPGFLGSGGVAPGGGGRRAGGRRAARRASRSRRVGSRGAWRRVGRGRRTRARWPGAWRREGPAGVAPGWPGCPSCAPGFVPWTPGGGTGMPPSVGALRVVAGPQSTLRSSCNGSGKRRRAGFDSTRFSRAGTLTR